MQNILTMSDLSLAVFGLPGGYEWIILLILGLLVFGRRLPEVGRSLGRGIVEFKRGVKGLDMDIDDEATKSTAPPERIEHRPAETIEPPADSTSIPVETPEKVAAARDDDPAG